MGSKNLASKVGALIRRNGFAADPKTGSDQRSFFPHFWPFQRAPSTPSDVAKHVGRNARALPSLTTPLLRQLAHHHHNAHRGGPCQRDRVLDRISDPIFGSYPATLFFPSRGPTSLRTFPTHWFPRLKQLLCVRESASRMYVAQLWPSACPCTLIVVPMRVLFPKKKENRSARFAKAATSSYLVDVSPTHSFARCVGLVGRLGLGRAHVRMDSSRLYSSSKPTSDPARSPTCVRLSV